MRKVLSVAVMAAALCLVGVTKDAGAALTIDLEWGTCGSGTGGCTATGTDTITVNPGGGQTLRLDVFLSHDLPVGLETFTFSLNFDSALDDELNFGAMAPVEWAGSDVDPGPAVSTFGPFTVGMTTLESTGAVGGRVNSIESGGLTGVLPANGVAYSVGTASATAPARYRVAQVFFVTNGATTDGADVFAGLFNGLFDGPVDGLGVPIPPGTITFGTATLNVVPEPGTVSLLGLGLVGLVLAGRRSRR